MGANASKQAGRQARSLNRKIDRPIKLAQERVVGSEGSKQDARTGPPGVDSAQSDGIPNGKQDARTGPPGKQDARTGPPGVDSAQSDDIPNGRPTEDNHEFYERLRRLGAVQVEPVQHKYQANSEMLDAIKTRQRLDTQTKAQLEAQQENVSVARRLVGPETITAILESRHKGKSEQQIGEDLNVARQVLEQIGRDLGIPQHRVKVRARAGSEVGSERRRPVDSDEGDGEVLDR